MVEAVMSGRWNLWLVSVWCSAAVVTGIAVAWTPEEMDWEGMCSHLISIGVDGFCDARIPFPSGFGESCCCGGVPYICGGSWSGPDWCSTDEICSPDPTSISFDVYTINTCDQISISIYNPILDSDDTISLYTLAQNLITVCECYATGVDFATSSFREGVSMGEIDQGAGPFIEGAIEVQICLAENCMIPPFWGLLCYDSGTPEALAEMEQRQEEETEDVLIVLPEVDDRFYALMAIALTKCAALGDCADIGEEFAGYLLDSTLAVIQGLQTWGARMLAFLLEPILQITPVTDSLDTVLSHYDLSTCNVIAGQEAVYLTLLDYINDARYDTDNLGPAALELQDMANMDWAVSSLHQKVMMIINSGSAAPSIEQASSMLSLPTKIMEIIDSSDSFFEFRTYVPNYRQNTQAHISSLQALLNVNISALEATLEPVGQQTHVDCISFLNGLSSGLLAEAQTKLATALDSGIISRLAQMEDITDTRIYPGIHIFMNTLTIDRDIPLPKGLTTKEFCLPDFEDIANAAGLSGVANEVQGVLSTVDLSIESECWDVPWPADIDTAARLPDIPLIPGMIPWLKLTFPFAQTASGVSDTLSVNQVLEPNDILLSPNGVYTLKLQGDGNLVIYAEGQGAIWSTGTQGQDVSYAKMQSDGNFVMYGSDGSAVWDTQSSGHGQSARLIMQNDGNLVVYYNAVAWSIA